jgi:hypothetical protein
MMGRPAFYRTSWQNSNLYLVVNTWTNDEFGFRAQGLLSGRRRTNNRVQVDSECCKQICTFTICTHRWCAVSVCKVAEPYDLIRSTKCHYQPASSRKLSRSIAHVGFYTKNPPDDPPTKDWARRGYSAFKADQERKLLGNTRMRCYLLTRPGEPSRCRLCCQRATRTGRTF